MFEALGLSVLVVLFTWLLAIAWLPEDFPDTEPLVSGVGFSFFTCRMVVAALSLAPSEHHEPS